MGKRGGFRFKLRKFGEGDRGVARVKVVPDDDEHSTSGIWGRFKKRLSELFNKATDEKLAESAIEATKSKLDEQSYKNKHVAAQIENELAETRLRHSEADKSASFIQGERRLLDAQAEKTEAEAAKIRRETQSIHIDNQLKLLDKFRESGMKVIPVFDEDGFLVGAALKGGERKTLAQLAPKKAAALKRRAEIMEQRAAIHRDTKPPEISKTPRTVLEIMDDDASDDDADSDSDK